MYERSPHNFRCEERTALKPCQIRDERYVYMHILLTKFHHNFVFMLLKILLCADKTGFRRLGHK